MHLHLPSWTCSCNDIVACETSGGTLARYAMLCSALVTPMMLPGEKTWWNKPGFHLSYMEPDPPYPFQRIKTEDGKDTGIVALIAPFYDTNYYKVRVAMRHFDLAWRTSMPALTCIAHGLHR